jgi:hypothetical protein
MKFSSRNFGITVELLIPAGHRVHSLALGIKQMITSLVRLVVEESS